MKLSNKFDDYITNYSNYALHHNYKNLYKSFPSNIKDLNNFIFYGPNGVGKYTQALASIYKYSPTKLNYEKKICINYSKYQYYIKISDIHYEVDMSLLGCNTKLLWDEIFNHIIDIILTKTNQTGIIVCKNFEAISTELLESFYSYMQTKHRHNIKVKFIILTSHISFIPDNIVNRCKTIHFARPSKAQYHKCLAPKNKIDKKISLNNISNISNLQTNITQLMCPHINICNKILDRIINIDNNKFTEIRELLYDIFIYDLDLTECVYYIIHELIKMKRIKTKHVSGLIEKTYLFFHLYNNNYRPIYHLESYIYYLIKTIHDFK